MNTDEFISKAKQKHGDRYDYSLVNYVNAHSKVTIICNKHGNFVQLATNHLSGKGCKLCVNRRVLSSNTDEFISKAKQKHGDKYDYSLVKYVNSGTKVKIICPDHGVFEQRASNHLSGIGCISCSGNKPITTIEFKAKAKAEHGNIYDYSLVDYNNNMTKVKIICPEHGAFEQVPYSHLKGAGCKKCDIVNRTLSIQEFIDKSNAIHDKKYDYSLVKYVNSGTKVKIICPDHGEFEQTPNSHLYGKGCLKCSYTVRADRNLYDQLSPFYEPDRVTYVYLLKIDNVNESFHKIGISVNIDNRMSTIRSQSNYNVTLLDKIETTVKDAIEIERKIHSKYIDNTYTPMIEFGGYTECFKLKGTKL